MLELTKTDLARCETVLKALKRGKYELEGEEVLAFAQAYAWLTTHMEKMKEAVNTPQPASPPPTKPLGRIKK